MATGNGVALKGEDLQPGSKLWETISKYGKIVIAIILGTATTVGTYYAFTGRVSAVEKDVVTMRAEVKDLKQLATAHDRAIIELQTQARNDDELKNLLRKVLDGQGKDKK